MKFDWNTVKSREGDIAIVTGANSGVGFEVTVGLAQKRCKVVMACRNAEKAEAAKNMILSRVPGADLEIMPLDLSASSSIHAFAENFRSRHQRLNLLINNAGVLDYAKRTNQAGIEMQFATNHLGHFLLTALLIDVMPNNAESRIVSTSSIAHKKGRIFFDDINCDNQPKWDTAYSQSKLACLMFSDELHHRLQTSGRQVLSVCTHPGATDSGLFENMPRLMYQAMKIFLGPFILHSTESAARPTLLAALDERVTGGQYYGPTGFSEMKGSPGLAKRTDYAKDRNVAQRLWDLSEKLTGQKFELQPHPGS